MSRKASEFQEKVMPIIYRGKGIFKPLNTGWIDEHVACVREYIANIFFYRKDGVTIMIDAGYNYPRLAEKMGWLDIDPAGVKHILITHQDTDHVGAVEEDSDGLFRDATLYIGEVENRYLTGEVRRKVMCGLYKLPPVTIHNPKVLVKDGQVLDIEGIRVECFLVPGHTWGHIVYLVDDAYLFTGDTLWFGADGGYSFINMLAEDNGLAVQSLAELERRLSDRGLKPVIITGHTGWTDNFDFAFAHRGEVCNSWHKQKPVDPEAPYNGYDESGDTEACARAGLLPKVRTPLRQPDYKNWVPQGMIKAFGAAAVGLGAASAAVAIGGKNMDKTARAVTAGVLGAGAVGCAAWTGWCIMANRRFSYTGRRKLAKEIIDNIAAYVTVPDGGVALDVGCGSGALANAVAKRNPGARVIGIDQWGPEYRSFSKTLCEKNAAAEGLTNVIFEKGNAKKLAFADESFDAVVSNYVYHNIAGTNKQKLLKESLRVLKKGGIFAIHDLMGPARYGDMQKFVQELKEEGYEEVHLIPTANGSVIGKAEGKVMFLADSCLLVGRK